MARRVGAHVGYARISTSDRDPEIQLAALRKAGCKKIFVDQMSGSRADRPQLQAARDYLRDGDTLVVWELSRFARSMEDFARWLREFRDSNLQLKVIDLALDTRTPHGKFAAHVYVASAELQAEVIRWNVREGLARAAKRGAVLGRLPIAPKTIRAIRSLSRAGELTVDEISAELGVHRASVYKYKNAPDSMIADIAELHDQHRSYRARFAKGGTLPAEGSKMSARVQGVLRSARRSPLVTERLGKGKARG